jgi:microcystin-dependent protein
MNKIDSLECFSAHSPKKSSKRASREALMDAFIGEIRLFSYDWVPKGWAFCNGALMSIQQNTALFSLLGTQYGGDGRVTFGLPDLRGRTPVAYGGAGYPIGASDGVENVTLTLTNLPVHNHAFLGTQTVGNAITAINRALAGTATTDPAHYAAPGALTPLNPASIAPAGSGISHYNMQPYLVLNYCIATSGVFPSRS